MHLAIDLLRSALTLPVAPVAFDDEGPGGRDSREEVLVKLLEFYAMDGRVQAARDQLNATPLKDPGRQAWLGVVLARQSGQDAGEAGGHAASRSVDVFERVYTLERVLSCGARAEQRLDHKDQLADALRSAAGRWPALHERGGAHRPLQPPTWVLPRDRTSLLSALDAAGGGSWMLKPARMADAHGVRRVSGGELRALVASSAAARRLARGTVAQRYVEDPLLWEGKKFDLRLYVLVASQRPLRLFLYGDGYARLAPLNFTLARSRDGKRDRRIHITNRSQHNKGNRRCARRLAELRHSLFGGPGGREAWASLWARIEEVLARSFVAALLQSAERSGLCGKVYGADVLIDGAGWPHVLEVNRAPAIDSGRDCPEVRAVHEPLAHDLVDGLLPSHAADAAAAAQGAEGAGRRRLERLARALLRHPGLQRADPATLRSVLRPALVEKDALLGHGPAGPRWSVLFPARAWRALAPLLDGLPAAEREAEAVAAEATALLLASPAGEGQR